MRRFCCVAPKHPDNLPSMDNVERGRAVHGTRVAVPPGNDGHALLRLAACPHCQSAVNADRGFLADCWNCKKPLPRRFGTRREIKVEWVLLDDIRHGHHPADTWICTCCGTTDPVSNRRCTKCKRSRHPADP
ncbi:hypothetical protein GCM10027570_43360 [Streptomonospora sediminis]